MSAEANEHTAVDAPEAQGQGQAQSPSKPQCDIDIQEVVDCINGKQPNGVECHAYEDPERDPNGLTYYVALKKCDRYYAARYTWRIDGSYDFDVKPVFKGREIYRYGRYYLELRGHELVAHDRITEIEPDYPNATGWALRTVVMAFAKPIAADTPVVGLWHDGWHDMFGAVKPVCDPQYFVQLLREVESLPTAHHKALALAILAKFISPAVASVHTTYVDHLLIVYGEGGEGKTTIARWIMDSLGNSENYYLLNNVISSGARARNLMAFDSRPAVVDEFQFSTELIQDSNVRGSLRDLVLAATGTRQQIGTYADQFGWRMRFYKTRTPILIGNADPRDLLTDLVGHSTLTAISRRIAVLEFPEFDWGRGPIFAHGRIDGCLVDLYRKYMTRFFLNKDFIATMHTLAEILYTEFGVDLRNAVGVVKSALNLDNTKEPFYVERRVIEQLLLCKGRHYYERMASCLSESFSNGCIVPVTPKSADVVRAEIERIESLIQEHPIVYEALKNIGRMFDIDVSEDGRIERVGDAPRLVLYVSPRCFRLPSRLPNYTSIPYNGRRYYRITLNNLLKALAAALEEREEENVEKSEADSNP